MNKPNTFINFISDIEYITQSVKIQQEYLAVKPENPQDISWQMSFYKAFSFIILAVKIILVKSNLYIFILISIFLNTIFYFLFDFY